MAFPSFPQLDQTMMPIYAALITLSGTVLLHAAATLLDYSRKRAQRRAEISALRTELYTEMGKVLPVFIRGVQEDTRGNRDSAKTIFGEGITFDVYSRAPI